MIIYKDILTKLKDAGYSTYRLRQEKLIPEATLTRIRNGEPISTETLETICKLTGLPVQDIIEYKNCSALTKCRKGEKMYESKLYNHKSIRVTEVENIDAPWGFGVTYSIYQDLYDNFYMDVDDNTDTIAKIDTDNLETAKQVLVDYLSEINDCQ